MPSPNNITELIIFVAGAIVVVLIVMVGTRHTRFGRKLTGNWKSGPIDQELEVEQMKRAMSPISHQREKYIDPLARFKSQYAIAGFIVFGIFVFVFYFMTKSTWQSGN
jgi:hypothetical protein